MLFYLSSGFCFLYTHIISSALSNFVISKTEICVMKSRTVIMHVWTFANCITLYLHFTTPEFSLAFVCFQCYFFFFSFNLFSSTCLLCTTCFFSFLFFIFFVFIYDLLFVLSKPNWTVLSPSSSFSSGKKTFVFFFIFVCHFSRFFSCFYDDDDGYHSDGRQWRVNASSWLLFFQCNKSKSSILLGLLLEKWINFFSSFRKKGFTSISLIC